MATAKVQDIPAMLGDIVLRKTVQLPSPLDVFEKPKTPPRDVLTPAQSPRARRVASSTTLAEAERPPKERRRDCSDFHFVTFFALGDHGDSGHTGFQFTKLDMSFAGVLRKSHPGHHLAIMTDMDTQFDFSGFDIEVCRNAFDRSKLGRNAYANLYQFQGQVAYLKKLQREGKNVNVVFMDTDILVLKSLAPVFEAEDFSFGCTISDSKAMPVNIGMQFVKAGRYGEAIRFLEDVLARYRLDPVEEFCAGQIAIAEELGLYDSYDAQLGICTQANSKAGYTVRTVGKHQHRVAFLACSRYNYCNMEDSCCTDPHRWMRPLVTPADFIEMDVRALHFVGWRKSGLAAVYNAFMAGDLVGAFQEFVNNYKMFQGGDYCHEDLAPKSAHHHSH